MQSNENPQTCVFRFTGRSVCHLLDTSTPILTMHHYGPMRKALAAAVTVIACPQPDTVWVRFRCHRARRGRWLIWLASSMAVNALASPLFEGDAVLMGGFGILQGGRPFRRPKRPGDTI